jgi:hypothetical protein
VAHLEEVVRVSQHELARAQLENVEFDEVDACFECGAKRAQRVLGGERCGAAVADPERPTASALE